MKLQKEPNTKEQHKILTRCQDQIEDKDWVDPESRLKAMIQLHEKDNKRQTKLFEKRKQTLNKKCNRVISRFIKLTQEFNEMAVSDNMFIYVRVPKDGCKRIEFVLKKSNHLGKIRFAGSVIISIVLSYSKNKIKYEVFPSFDNRRLTTLMCCDFYYLTETTSSAFNLALWELGKIISLQKNR